MVGIPAKLACAAVLAAGLTGAHDAAAQEACRQALALGLDVSGSVDETEYRLQINGLASALEDPEVKSRILQIPSAPIRLAVFEWSTPDAQYLLLPWTTLRTEADLLRATAILRRSGRTPGDYSTAIGAAINFGAGLLNQQRNCWKRTLDISGDGKSNTGPHPREITRFAQLPGTAAFEDITGLTINGLVIGADDPNIGDVRLVEIGELSSYYNAYVIYGPDAFVETALGFRDFKKAMTRKLLRELEGLAVSQLDRQITSPAPPPAR